MAPCLQVNRSLRIENAVAVHHIARLLKHPTHQHEQQQQQQQQQQQHTMVQLDEAPSMSSGTSASEDAMVRQEAAVAGQRH
ncbi:MAG: hypothetical protein ACK4ZJ_18095 [Allorhizobium sp.]